MEIPRGEIVIYRAEDGGDATLDVRLEDETVWLTQKQISELFQTERSVVTKHVRNVFDTGELDRESVCAKFAHTAADGKTYQTQYYNLDLILSVGYRVNSKRGTQFRIWASSVPWTYPRSAIRVDARWRSIPPDTRHGARRRRRRRN